MSDIPFTLSREWVTYKIMSFPDQRLLINNNLSRDLLLISLPVYEVKFLMSRGQQEFCQIQRLQAVFHRWVICNVKFSYYYTM